MPYIDYTALRVKPSPRKVAAWRESVRQRDEQAGLHGPASYPRTRHASRWVGIVAVLAASFAVIGLLAGLNMLLQQGETFGIFAVAVVAALVFGAFWVYFQWRVRQLAEGWTQPYRLMAFADDNQLHAVPVTGPGELPGRIFGRGLEGNRVRHDVVAWTQSGRECHVATESWHSGKPPMGAIRRTPEAAAISRSASAPLTCPVSTSTRWRSTPRSGCTSLPERRSRRRRSSPTGSSTC